MIKTATQEMSLIESWVLQKAAGFISPLSSLPKYCNPGEKRNNLLGYRGNQDSMDFDKDNYWGPLKKEAKSGSFYLTTLRPQGSKILQIWNSNIRIMN